MKNSDQPSPEFLRIRETYGLDKLTPAQYIEGRADKAVITTAGGATPWLGKDDRRVRRGYGYAPPHQTPA